MNRITLGLALAVGMLMQSPLAAGPITVGGDTAHSTSGLGDFEATLTYSFTDANNATLTLTLTNTTPAAGGYITAFVLNNPGNAIGGITQSEADLELLGSAPFQDGVNAAPYGQFDFGVSTGGGFEGGGPPSNGLGVGETGTVTFTLTGDGLNLLDELSFFDEKSVPPGDGKGHEFLVVRFRGMDTEPGSDKVPGYDNPEPSTLLLSLFGIGTLVPAWRARRRLAN